MNKRIFRNLKENLGRYLAMFILTILVVGMGVGYLSGTNSSEDQFKQYLEDNKLEDGLISFDGEIGDDIKKDIEDLGVTLYDNFYIDESTIDKSTIRIFSERKDVDLPSVVEGKLPSSENEIFLDQLYAKAHNLNVGDKIKIKSISYKVSGVGCLPDYTISLESSSQMLADRNSFGVSMVTEEAFNKINSSNITYNYAFKLVDDDLSEDEQKELLNKIVKTAACVSPIEDYGDLSSSFEKMSNAKEVKGYSSILNNKRVATVASKMDTNKSMAVFFVVIVLLIIAFIFSIFSIHSIEQECSMIGTLLALGLNKKEIRRHYLILPCALTFVGSLIGAILGMTTFLNIPVSSLRGYYSLPSFNLEFDPIVMVIALLAPTILIFLINYISLLRKLSISPLKLIRKDIKKTKGRGTSHLTMFSFDTRFKLRILSQSIGSYIILFIGIFLAGWLMMFGIGMSSSYDNYIEEQSNSICEYQYSLKNQCEINNKDAEKATACNFDIYYKLMNQSYGMVGYGINEDSKYFKNIDLPGYGEVIISDDAAKKFNIKKGDKITLTNSSTGKKFKFKVTDIYNCNMGLAVFMKQSEMNNILRQYKDYYNFVFSDEKLDLKDKDVASVITTQDLRDSGQVMKDTSKSMLIMFPSLAVIIYVIIMYLLIKMVIAKNETGISMLKIFGYKENEIRKMYINTTTIVVILSVLITLPIQNAIMLSIWPSCIATVPGYVDFVMKYSGFIIIGLTGVISYLVTNTLNLRHIKKIPMTIALKNQE